MGKATARALGFQPGSQMSSYTQLYVAFIVSGLAHSAGDAMVGPQYTGLSFSFFLLQAVAITAEDCVIGLARRAGMDTQVSTMTRVFGYVWVTVWFMISMPLLLNFQIAIGMGTSEILPISLIRYGVRMLNETMGVDIAPRMSI